MSASGNLVASHPANVNAVRHGLYSPRALAPRAAEIADALMTLGHVQPLDRLAAEEIGSVIARLEAVGAGTVVHDGDPVLASHVVAAAASLDEYGAWKVRKAKQSRKIDGLVASVLAHARAAASTF